MNLDAKPDIITFRFNEPCCARQPERAQLFRRLGTKNEASNCSMVNPQWSMVNDLRSMVNAQWSMLNGQCSMFNVQCSMLNAQCSIMKQLYPLLL